MNHQTLPNDQNAGGRRRVRRLVITGAIALLLLGGLVSLFNVVPLDGPGLDNLRVAWEEKRRAFDEYRRTWDDKRRAREQRQRAENQAYRQAAPPATNVVRAPVPEPSRPKQ